MTAQVRQTLKQVEEQWLQWIVQNNRQQADRAVSGLLDTARQLGMRRLPDLSAGATARAVQSARQKDFARAHWELDAAERFDPGRPETAFAEARVDFLEGNYLGAAAARLRGYPRLFNNPFELYLWLQDLLLWVLFVLLVTGGLFVAVQMLTKGDLSVPGPGGALRPQAAAPAGAGAGGRRPALAAVPPARHDLAAALRVGAALGVRLGERAHGDHRRSGSCWAPRRSSWSCSASACRVALSPPAQAMESLEGHRLYGSLFSDLGVLRSVLPQSVAVKHLLADVHRSLNQWELARALYRQVLEAEPNNTTALLNLGDYSFIKGDFSSAIQNFQNAAAADPQNAAAQYNLSQAYSESYMFDEQKVALNKAQEIDLARVNGWMANPQTQRVVALPGGIARIPEIRRELPSSWGHREVRSGPMELFRRGLSVFLSLSLVLVAVTLHLARRPFGYTERSVEVFPEGAFDRWGRILLPGVASAEIGEGWRSFLALLLPTALLMLPLFGTLGVRIPWRYDPGNLLSWIFAILGLAIYFGVRLRRELRHGG